MPAEECSQMSKSAEHVTYDSTKTRLESHRRRTKSINHRKRMNGNAAQCLVPVWSHRQSKPPVDIGKDDTSNNSPKFFRRRTRSRGHGGNQLQVDLLKEVTPVSTETNDSSASSSKSSGIYDNTSDSHQSSGTDSIKIVKNHISNVKSKFNGRFSRSKDPRVQMLGNAVWYETIPGKRYRSNSPERGKDHKTQVVRNTIWYERTPVHENFLSQLRDKHEETGASGSTSKTSLPELGYMTTTCSSTETQQPGPKVRPVSKMSKPDSTTDPQHPSRPNSIWSWIFHILYIVLYGLVLSCLYLFLLYASLVMFFSIVHRSPELYPFNLNLTQELSHYITMAPSFLFTPASSRQD